MRVSVRACLALGATITVAIVEQPWIGVALLGAIAVGIVFALAIRAARSRPEGGQKFIP
jgi:hypothetical protein